MGKLKERAGRLRTDIPAVFLAMRRMETPLAAKIFAGIAIGYALSPIDLIPDFIPVLGMLDDLLIVPFFAAAAIRRIPKEVFAECREQAAGLWENGRPKKWYFALPIVLFWLLAALIAAKLVWL